MSVFNGFFFYICSCKEAVFSGRCAGVFFCGGNSSGRPDYRWWTRAEEMFFFHPREDIQVLPGGMSAQGLRLSQPEGWQSQLTLLCIVNRMLKGAFFSSARSD